MTTTDRNPDWLVELEARFAVITPDDLPKEPWVLQRTPDGGGMSPIGGVFIKVADNEAYLKHLRYDLSKGERGPRRMVIMSDLSVLKEALSIQGRA